MRCYAFRPQRETHGLLEASSGSYGVMGLALKRRDLFGAVAALAALLNLRYENYRKWKRENGGCRSLGLRGPSEQLAAPAGFELPQRDGDAPRHSALGTDLVGVGRLVAIAISTAGPAPS